MHGNRISIAVGVVIAGIGTRFLEDGNLFVTSVITLVCAGITRSTWELIKKVAGVRR